MCRREAAAWKGEHTHMKKSTWIGITAAAAGAAGWYLAANSRKRQVEHIRREARRLLAVRKDELTALRAAAEQGELATDAMGPVPLDGVELDSLRLEHGAAVVALRSGKAAAWISSKPLDWLEVPTVSWRGGSISPGVLYTEYLRDGWYAGYACLSWR